MSDAASSGWPEVGPSALGLTAGASGAPGRVRPPGEAPLFSATGATKTSTSQPSEGDRSLFVVANESHPNPSDSTAASFEPVPSVERIGANSTKTATPSDASHEPEMKPDSFVESHDKKSPETATSVGRPHSASEFTAAARNSNTEAAPDTSGGGRNGIDALHPNVEPNNGQHLEDKAASSPTAEMQADSIPSTVIPKEEPNATPEPSAAGQKTVSHASNTATQRDTFVSHPLKIRSRVSVQLEGEEQRANGTVLEVVTTLADSHPIHSRVHGRSSEPSLPRPKYSYYLHFDLSDHRMDRWVDAELIAPPVPVHLPTPPHPPDSVTSTSDSPHAFNDSGILTLGKRKRAELESLGKGIFDPEYVARAKSPSPGLSNVGISCSLRQRDHRERDRDREKHLVRNIQRVVFGAHDIGTWYYSPYPLEDEDLDGMSEVNGNGSSIQRHSSPSNSVSITSNGQRKVAHLYVCEGCFKYMRTPEGWKAHTKECTFKHPPGKKVYQRGAHTIWEIQGSQQKLYAQCLSMFGKLFIDHKTIFFDVEPFVFYVLTDASSSFDHPVGYFSKEIVSYDDYNLACIATFPPYQRGGFGSLMVEFSYYLSARAGYLGTPERPLSDLGLRGYRSFWVKALLLMLGHAFNLSCLRDVMYPKTQFAPNTGGSLSSAARAASHAALADWRIEVARVRALLAGQPAPLYLGKVPENQMSESERLILQRQRRALKGWAGEAVPMASSGATVAPTASPAASGTDGDAANPSATAKRRHSTASGPAASAGKRRRNASLTPSAEVAPEETPDRTNPEDIQVGRDLPSSFMSSVDITVEPPPLMTLETTVERLARASNLRPEDACVALAHSNLLLSRLDPAELSSMKNDTPSSVVGQEPKAAAIFLSSQKVEEALSDKRVKKPLMELKYVLI